MHWLARLGLIGLSLCTTVAAAPSGRDTLWGVNDSGLEFGKGAKAGTNYAVPDPTYYLSQGFQLVRLPFQIARLVPVPGGALDPVFTAVLQSIIDKDRAFGAVTVLDPHGYGFMDKDGTPRDILLDAAARADYVDMMRRMAAAFQTDGLAIGLMNEPHTGSDDAYAPIWNDAIAAMRQAGYHGVVLVPHAHWSSAADISPDRPYVGQITDPDRNWVLELHSYLDPDNTGTYRKPVESTAIGAARLSGAIAWSRQTGIRLFLGETGGPADPIGLGALTTMLASVSAAPDVFWGITLWGAGPWWKPNYPMRLDPIDGIARPQLVALRQAMSPQTLYLAKDAGAPDQKVSISVDGHVVETALLIVADRTAGPQAVSIHQKLPPGNHVVSVQPAGGSGGLVYVLGASWKGKTNSTDAFGMVPAYGSELHIVVPG